MIKEKLKSAIGHTAFWLHRRSLFKHPVVIYYHRVVSASQGQEEAISNPLLCMGSKRFDAQCRYLKENYSVLSLEDYIACKSRHQTAPQKSILITFDDGYLDNYRLAYPILRKYRLPATIFVTTNMIGTPHLFWWDKLYAILMMVQTLTQLDLFKDAIRRSCPREDQRLAQFFRATRKKELFAIASGIFRDNLNQKNNALLDQLSIQLGIDLEHNQRRYLNWNEIEEMRDNGIDFGSHTCNHENLANIDDTKLEYEVGASKSVLESRLGKIKSFSYPYGCFSPTAEQKVKDAGYEVAFATTASTESHGTYLIPRHQIKDRSPFDETFRFNAERFNVELYGMSKRIKAMLKFVT